MASVRVLNETKRSEQYNINFANRLCRSRIGKRQVGLLDGSRRVLGRVGLFLDVDGVRLEEILFRWLDSRCSHGGVWFGDHAVEPRAGGGGW